MTIARSLAAVALPAVLLAAGSADARSKSTKVAPSKLSDEIVIVDDVVLVPVDDLVATVGCTLQLVPESRAYEAWPCRPAGAFRVDLEVLEGFETSTKVSKAEAQGFNPQPDPPRELHLGEHIVSRSVIVREGRGYLALSEVAVLMDGSVKGKGAKARIVVGKQARGVITLRKAPVAAAAG